MRLCLLLWVLADKALTHITPSSTDHNQSIIPEDREEEEEGGRGGLEKKRRGEERPQIVECPPPLFFCSTLFSPGAMTKAGWKGAHCRTDRIICHCLYFFPLPLFLSLSYTHTLTGIHTITLPLSLSPSLSPSLSLSFHLPRGYVKWDTKQQLSSPNFPSLPTSFDLTVRCHHNHHAHCCDYACVCVCVCVHISSPRLINNSIAQIAKSSR